MLSNLLVSHRAISLVHSEALSRPIDTVLSSSDSPSFEPTPKAIRINVLWFASLVVSLSTASFAIQVKQWLRAYLSLATSSPQGRLRLRHFRRTGLETWKVFEIAAILPLLLQVALGLCFIGLCFFTASIHSSIGNTTLPLVIAWGVFSFLATIWPAFSARCPYKTPAMKTVTTSVRTNIYQPTARAVASFALFMAIIVYISIDMVVTVLLFIPKICSVFMLGVWIESPVRYLRRMLKFLRDGLLNWHPQEEYMAINDSNEDLDILASADALQINDELLATTMKDALEQSEPRWEDVVLFLAKAIQNLQ